MRQPPTSRVSTFTASDAKHQSHFLVCIWSASGWTLGLVDPTRPVSHRRGRARYGGEAVQRNSRTYREEPQLRGDDLMNGDAHARTIVPASSHFFDETRINQFGNSIVGCNLGHAATSLDGSCPNHRIRYEALRTMRVPATTAKWSTWKVYRDSVGVTMGRAVAMVMDR